MKAGEALENLVYDDESHRGAMNYEGEFLIYCLLS